MCSRGLVRLSWLPEWLGLAYGKLYHSYEGDLFTFDDAAESVGERNPKLVVSLLRRKGWLIVFGREGRRRRYRLMEPRVALTALTLEASVIPKQGRYAHLVASMLAELVRRYDPSLHSVAVFGSIARGTATLTSDLDVLVVADFNTQVTARIDKLVDLEYSGRIWEELAWLKSHGVHSHISWFPLTLNEAARFRPLYLDMAEDAMIVYDKNNFLKRIFDELRSRMKREGARRVWLDKERWIWSTKPEFCEEPLIVS